ncbi:unnamed protein product [Caenorhabditis sp. 36 PRJEB53466]|nr:unnamed protein product [Caenorhabditis sp. 36 PRJEB53466]
MSAKMNRESGGFEWGTDDLKRFFQWILGCTYTKKTFRTRIAEMFHFAEAPHIIIYERNEANPWWWTVAIIVAVLIGVLCLYYTLEAALRAVRSFLVAVLREPQSTVSTPRCLSPNKETRKPSPQTPQNTPEHVGRKIPMNEPVNCVFVRPVSPKTALENEKLSIPQLNSEDEVDTSFQMENPKQKTPPKENKKSPHPKLEEVEFDAASNVNCRPTAVPSYTTQISAPRKSSGAEDGEPTVASSSWCSTGGPVEDWIQKQLDGCQKITEDRSKAGEETEQIEPQTVSAGFLEQIEDLIKATLNQPGALLTEESSCENDSELSESPMPSLVERISSEIKSGFTDFTQKSTSIPQVDTAEKLGKEAEGTEEDADIIIEDSCLFATSDNECDGSILVRDGPQKVLFRWTDDRPETVDNVTVTGSFFGWNMHLPLRRRDEKTFEVCVQLPAGMHDYLINIFRFD